MRQQLSSKKKGDQPKAGIQAVVDVYRQVRGRIDGFTDTTADRWLQLDSAGQFGPVADSLATHPTKDCP